MVRQCEGPPVEQKAFLFGTQAASAGVAYAKRHSTKLIISKERSTSTGCRPAGLLRSITGTVLERQAGPLEDFAGESPEIDCRVSSPGPPSQRVFFKFTRTPQIERVRKMTVSRRKRVGLPKCAHGHPLCCPFCNSGNFAKPPEERIGVRHSIKADLSNTNSTRESPNGISLRSRQTNALQIRLG